MCDCVRCGLPLYESDKQSRELILCCIFNEKICPTCLADFMDQDQPQVLSICQRCGRKIKLTDLHRKYNLYTNNIDRIMASSRVRYPEFEMGSHQIKKPPSFYGGFEGFGMGRMNMSMGMANQNAQGWGFNRGCQPIQMMQHQNQSSMFSYAPPTNRVQEVQLSILNHPELVNKEKIQQANITRLNPLHTGKIYYNDSPNKPISMTLNEMNLGEEEFNQQYQVQTREPIYTQSFKRTNNFQHKPENNFKQIYQPSFGHSNYFACEGANRRMEIEKNQRSLSSEQNRNAYQNSHQQQPRPLSSNSRVCRADSRVEKSPPSFGKEQL